MLCCPCFPVLVFGWSESSKCDPTGNLERCCKQKDKGFQIYISLGHIFSLSNRYLELLFRSRWPIGQLFSFIFSQKLACLYLSILEHDRIINAWEVHHARFEGFFLSNLKSALADAAVCRQFLHSTRNWFSFIVSQHWKASLSKTTGS